MDGLDAILMPTKPHRCGAPPGYHTCSARHPHCEGSAACGGGGGLTRPFWSWQSHCHVQAELKRTTANGRGLWERRSRKRSPRLGRQSRLLLSQSRGVTDETTTAPRQERCYLTKRLIQWHDTLLAIACPPHTSHVHTYNPPRLWLLHPHSPTPSVSETACPSSSSSPICPSADGCVSRKRISGSRLGRGVLSNHRTYRTIRRSQPCG